MWGDYEFQIDEQLLLYLEISPAFAPSVFFRIGKNSHDEYIVYWRKGLQESEFYHKIKEELDSTLKSVRTLNEFYQTPEYQAFLETYSPINRMTLNDYQKSLVANLIRNGLNKDAGKYGIDGHSYHLTLYRPNPERFHSWCMLPKEWKGLKFVIDFLVKEVAKLDNVRYGVYTK